MATGDMRLYNKSGRYETVIVGEPESEVMSSSLLSQAAATGMEVLSNKVVKYMLTAKGTYALDADYGSRLTTYSQISQSMLQRIYLELAEDVRQCAEFIKANEVDESEKLASLKLERIHYDPKLTPQRLDVYIRIIAADGTTALLDIRS